MKILLDRPVGFIGSALSKAITKLGYDCLLPNDPNAHDADALILLNWGSVPSSTAKNPPLELSRSLAPFIEVLPGYLKQKPKQTILVSSAGALYGSGPGLISESTPLAPSSVYGAGKAAAEMFSRVCAQDYACPLRIVRPSNVYGPGQAMRAGFGVIPSIYSAITSGNVLPLWPGSLGRRDYLYIDDFVNALIAVLQSVPGEPVDVFNIASGVHANVPELIHIAESTLGTSCAVQSMQGASTDSSRLLDVLPDSSIFRARFGWRAETDITSGISKTFDALRQQ